MMISLIRLSEAANVHQKALTPLFKLHAVAPWARVAVIAEVRLNFVRYWPVPKSERVERSPIQMFI